MRKVMLCLALCLCVAALGANAAFAGGKGAKEMPAKKVAQEAKKAPATTFNETDLMKAVNVDKPNFEKVLELLTDGADVNAIDKNGETALMKAAAKTKEVAVIDLLIDRGANLNLVDKNGQTALIKAARANTNPDILSALVKAGANTTIADKSGKTAANYAKSNKNLRKHMVIDSLDDQAKKAEEVVNEEVEAAGGGE